MRDFLQEYFIVVSAYNRADGVAKSLRTFSTKKTLEELASVVPSSSRLFAEVNKYLRMNFSQPRKATQ